MKFILLESRGGNYLVVAENVAWLRTAENGQTNVGIVGGQPLLVVGSVEEVAAKIIAASVQEEPPVPEPLAAPPLAEPLASAEPAVVQPEPGPEPEPAQLAPAPPPPAVEAAVASPPRKEASERHRPTKPQSLSLSDRLAIAAAPRVKAGSQRFMGMAE